MIKSSRWFGFLLALGLILGLAAPLGQRASASTIKIDSLLTQQLALLAPGATLDAILTYDHKPTAADVAAAQTTGVLVHQFDVLPMLAVRGTASQIRATFNLGGLTSIFYNKQLRYLMNQSVRTIGADRVWNELGYTGRGIGVAIIDSGVDGTHADLQPAMAHNVKVLTPNILVNGSSSISAPLPNTDTTSGHGTHVAGTIGGRGTNSGGYYRGVAPGSKLIGIGTGDAISILYALEGFDYVLEKRAQYNIRVVSNSWGTTGEYDADDPINVASKAAHDAGITVVFAAGNSGPGQNTLNPYSVAPWVIGVAAGEKDGRTLASFSSRGIPGSALHHPTITAPGVAIVSTRAPNSILPVLAITDDLNIQLSWIPYYTTMSGTSMATPHISGVVALMLEANPALTPDAIKNILVQTATPMSGYQQFEVGAGYVNAYAAVSRAKAP
ncbi:MAG TPA: S8 family serine peptidase [Herpetosiphonaceae bacterium]